MLPTCVYLDGTRTIPVYSHEDERERETARRWDGGASERLCLCDVAPPPRPHLTCLTSALGGEEARPVLRGIIC